MNNEIEYLVYIDNLIKENEKLENRVSLLEEKSKTKKTFSSKLLLIILFLLIIINISLTVYILVSK